MPDLTAQPQPMSIAEFIAWEERQEEKHEFCDGRVLAFAGGTNAHHGLAAKVLGSVLPFVKPCRTYGSDALIGMERSMRYADVLVTCDERDLPQQRFVAHPKLIVEVLSESTAQDDLTTKRDEYLGIDTLEEYVTIDSRRPWAQVLRRTHGDWVLSLPVTAGVLELRSIGLTLDLAALYDGTGVVEPA